MKQILLLVLVLSTLAGKWWEPACPPCPEPVVCNGAPCFMGQRCHDVEGCLPRLIRDKGFSGDTLSLHLDVTGQGGVAMAGSFAPAAEEGEDPVPPSSLLARLTPRGEMKWSRSYGPADQEDSADHVRVGDDSSLWLAGTFLGDLMTHQALKAPGHGGRDLYVLKLMGGGRPLWLQSFGTPEDERIHGLEVGEEGNAYLVSDQGKDGAFVLRRISPDGQVAWEKRFPGTSPVFGLYREDQLYLAARFTAPTIKVQWEELALGEGERQGLWLARLDWDGDLVWARTLPGLGERSVQDIAAMKDGDIILGGFGALEGFPSVQGRGEIFAARLSPAGTPEHLVRFGPEDPAQHSEVSVIPARQDRVHVVGAFEGRFHWNRSLPRPDLDRGVFVGTIEADGAPGAATVLPLHGPVAPLSPALDDAELLHMITRGEDHGFHLLTIKP